ncbi:hypothetical protein NQ317_004450 [Molorchus minor]|uniref:Tyr recombinase domain-containing protein n=1 Tax=Molorchus minor TaxID=1323400 RepID=A0ABQ9IXZ0_9CUCU|nr:hypothetical protein NQ317_004450 [Molorchus minor]
MVPRKGTLRPPTPHQRFFVNYKKGKNVPSSAVCRVKQFRVDALRNCGIFKLPNPEIYTGHSFRRSSATLLANSGEGLTDIKRLGGWKSTTVAEGYIERLNI